MKFARKKFKWAAWIFLGMGIFLFIFWFGSRVYRCDQCIHFQEGMPLPEVDVIVCLGGGKGRVAQAGEVWNRYWESFYQSEEDLTTSKKKIPTLYLAGMGPQYQWSLFVKQLDPILRQRLTPTQVHIENQSINTFENAIYFAKFAQSKGWTKILLLTSSYHLRRAQLIFEATLSKAPVQLLTTQVIGEPFSQENWWKSWTGIQLTFLEAYKALFFYWNQKFLILRTHD